MEAFPGAEGPFLLPKKQVVTEGKDTRIFIKAGVIIASAKIKSMPAYIMVDVDIHDFSQYEEYKKLTPASVTAFGGKFIVRGGTTETLEGDWKPGRIVVLEFPTLERAKEWWASAMYAPAKALRQRISATRMIVVEGVS